MGRSCRGLALLGSCSGPTSLPKNAIGEITRYGEGSAVALQGRRGKACVRNIHTPCICLNSETDQVIFPLNLLRNPNDSGGNHGMWLRSMICPLSMLKPSSDLWVSFIKFALTSPWYLLSQNETRRLPCKQRRSFVKAIRTEKTREVATVPDKAGSGTDCLAPSSTENSGEKRDATPEMCRGVSDMLSRTRRSRSWRSRTIMSDSIQNTDRYVASARKKRHSQSF